MITVTVCVHMFGDIGLNSILYREIMFLGMVLKLVVFVFRFLGFLCICFYFVGF